MAGAKEFYREVRGSVSAAAVLLAFDVVVYGSILMSTIFCPVWIVVSLVKNAIQRPGWRLALVRIGIPALTFWVVWVNNDFQLALAEVKAQRVVAACEEYHATNGRYPRDLDELVPQYMRSVPFAKYCLGPGSRFLYTNARPILSWEVVPPHLHRVYNFNTRSWSYYD